jgi:sulfur-oxidizing protein SoxY
MGRLMMRACLVVWLLGAALLQPAQAQIKTGDDPDGSENWKKVRTSLFHDRAIAAASEAIVALEAPARAEDAAVVPISIRAGFVQSETYYIDKIWLIIDNNPSPVSAIFSFTPASGRADIETRVRVDEYTHVRAIAELNDGSLHMATRWVKASGGCSAPPGKDALAALATLGRMKLRIEDGGGHASSGRDPLMAQLMISHPNNSGLAMEQFSRQFTPAHFVRRIDISYAGQLVMSADIDFSISENPNLRFYFLPRNDGELKAEVVDSRDLRFEGAVAYRATR